MASSEPGVGKSLVVQRLTEQVQNLPNNQFISEVMEKQDQEPPPLCVTIPFHDKLAHVSDAVGFFLPHAIPVRCAFVQGVSPRLLLYGTFLFEIRAIHQQVN